MEYILFIHNNTDIQPDIAEWEHFFELAGYSGMFQGGSEIGKRVQLGTKNVTDTTKSVVGYMRFESDNIEAIEKLLADHPVLKNGGTLELRELPQTKQANA